MILNNIQQASGLDAIDLAILKILSADGRITNADLSQRVGLAPSSCLNRVRSLVERGVIEGFSAEINPRALGLQLQALISVSLRAGARASLASFQQEMQVHPQVVQVFFLGGSEDFIVHVAASSSDELREFVLENLSNNASVANTRTNLIFDYFHKGPLA